MPDLTIKPVAAAGNKVILQDQAGNTRLQTDDAGITITAPTIASMANCTFPAGHVLQIKNALVTAYSADTLVAGDNYIVNGTTAYNGDFQLGITPKASGSWFLVSVRWNGHCHNMGDGGFNVLKNGVRVNAPSDTNAFIQSMGAHDNGSSFMRNVAFETLDKTGSTKGTSISFCVVYNHESSSHACVTNRCSGGSTDETAYSELIVKEVAQ